MNIHESVISRIIHNRGRCLKSSIYKCYSESQKGISAHFCYRNLSNSHITISIHPPVVIVISSVRNWKYKAEHFAFSPPLIRDPSEIKEDYTIQKGNTTEHATK